MSNAIKIAIIGDYNFTYNSHQATNLSIDHAARFLETEVNYYWIKLTEAVLFKEQQFEQFDGVWIAPVPQMNGFYLQGILRLLMQLKIPVLITGEGFKVAVESLISAYQLNQNGEKLISDNLVEGAVFETVSIVPYSPEFIQLYRVHSTTELTSSRFSLYPQLIRVLEDRYVDVEAYNQFDEPEVLSLKNHPFFVFCGFCPQISSTREMPHPLIYTFIKIATAMVLIETVS